MQTRSEKITTLKKERCRLLNKKMDILHLDVNISRKIWVDFISHFESNTTIGSYRSDIIEVCSFLNKHFIEINSSDVKELFTWFSNRVEQGEIKPATMAKKFRECHSLAQYICANKENYDLKKGYEDFFNPYLKLVAKQEKFAKSIPIEEIDKLFSAAQADMMAYMIFLLLFRVGLSSTEIMEIKEKDIEQYADGVYLWIKNRKEACYLSDDVVCIMAEYLKQRRDNEYLFYNRSGRQLNAMYISRMMKKYTALAGVPSYSAEALRNSCGFTMYAYGAKDKHVAKQLGITQMQIKRYDGIYYKNNIQKQAQNLVKLKVEPPV